MLAIVAAHTPVSPDYFAALWPPARWYTLKPFISTRGGTLSLTADTHDQEGLHVVTENIVIHCNKFNKTGYALHLVSGGAKPRETWRFEIPVMAV
jgi:hypothetical protein